MHIIDRRTVSPSYRKVGFVTSARTRGWIVEHPSQKWVNEGVVVTSTKVVSVVFTVKPCCNPALTERFACLNPDTRASTRNWSVIAAVEHVSIELVGMLLGHTIFKVGFECA